MTGKETDEVLVVNGTLTTHATRGYFVEFAIFPRDRVVAFGPQSIEVKLRYQRLILFVFEARMSKIMKEICQSPTGATVTIDPLCAQVTSEKREATYCQRCTVDSESRALHMSQLPVGSLKVQQESSGNKSSRSTITL